MWWESGIINELCKGFAENQATVKELCKIQQQHLAELRTKLYSTEKEAKCKSEELDSLQMKLLESKAENAQLKEKIKTMGPLLEADQVRETEKDKDLHLSSKAKVNQSELRLQEKQT